MRAVHRPDDAVYRVKAQVRRHELALMKLWAELVKLDPTEARGLEDAIDGLANVTDTGRGRVPRFHDGQQAIGA